MLNVQNNTQKDILSGGTHFHLLKPRRVNLHWTPLTPFLPKVYPREHVYQYLDALNLAFYKSTTPVPPLKMKGLLNAGV